MKGNQRPRGAPIAIRDLHVVASQDVVTVQVCRPQQVSNGEWRCAFVISTAESEDVQYAHGTDSLQALILAIEGCRVRLESYDGILRWEGGDEGDTGIPQFVPSYFGRDFADRIRALIDEEVEKFSVAAEQRGEDTKM